MWFISILQLAHPDRTDGLVLVNCTASKPGWTEWGYQKVSPAHMAASVWAIVISTLQIIDFWGHIQTKV